jgi:hypothetical protein
MYDDVVPLHPRGGHTRVGPCSSRAPEEREGILWDSDEFILFYPFFVLAVRSLVILDGSSVQLGVLFKNLTEVAARTLRFNFMDRVASQLAHHLQRLPFVLSRTVLCTCMPD